MISPASWLVLGTATLLLPRLVAAAADAARPQAPPLSAESAQVLVITGSDPYLPAFVEIDAAMRKAVARQQRHGCVMAVRADRFAAPRRPGGPFAGRYAAPCSTAESGPTPWPCPRGEPRCRHWRNPSPAPPATSGRSASRLWPSTHSVPTVSHIVDDGRSAILISTDSGPTGGLWKATARLPRLKAIFLGTSFPDEERELAAVAGHLTPALVALGLSKMRPGVPVYAAHIKPGHRQRVLRQLRALKRPNLFTGDSGRHYEF